MKTHLCLLILISLGLSTLSSNTLRADVVAHFDFEANSALEETFQGDFGLGTSRDSHTDSTASFYQTRGGAFSSFDTGITPNVSNFKNHAFVFSNNTNDVSNLSATNFYHEFSVEIDNGDYSLESLEFEYWVNNTVNTTDFSVSVFSDRTGYANELIRYDYLQQTANPQVSLIQNVEADLSQFGALQNLSAGDEVEFRLVFSDNFPNGFVHRIDDVILSASAVTPVPEPSTAVALAAAGILGLLRRRR